MTKDEALKMAYDWVNEYAPPEVVQACKDALETPECNPHPKAPHGFNRNASHSADRYVCECEGWQLEWQGLSDDEIAKLNLDGYADEGELEFARAIEQALKDKNL